MPLPLGRRPAASSTQQGPRSRDLGAMSPSPHARTAWATELESSRSDPQGSQHLPGTDQAQLWSPRHGKDGCSCGHLFCIREGRVTAGRPAHCEPRSWRLAVSPLRSQLLLVKGEATGGAGRSSHRTSRHVSATKLSKCVLTCEVPKIVFFFPDLKIRLTSSLVWLNKARVPPPQTPLK